MAAATGGTPGNAELMRIMEALRGDVRDLSTKLDSTAVRKDVYASDRSADALQMQAIEDGIHLVNKRIDKTEEKQTATWRLTLAGLIYPLLVAVMLFLIFGGHH